MRRVRDACADKPVIRAVGHRSAVGVERYKQHALLEDVPGEEVVEGGPPRADDRALEVGCDERTREDGGRDDPGPRRRLPLGLDGIEVPHHEENRAGRKRERERRCDREPKDEAGRALAARAARRGVRATWCHV
jgi:hypothetical protein